MLLFQVACDEDVSAEPEAPHTTVKIVFLNADGGTGDIKIYVADADGSNRQLVPVAMPSGWEIHDHAKLSSDGTIFFVALAPLQSCPSSGADMFRIYSVNQDGSNLKLVIEECYNDGESWLTGVN